jgi:hypothetical protein
MPSWRQDDDGGSFALVITRAGLKAIGADAGQAESDEPRPPDGETEAPHARSKGRGTRESGRVASSAPPAAGTKPAEFRAGSKQALILSMAAQENGREPR